MAQRVYANNWETTLAADITTTGQLTMTVQTGLGATAPDVSSSGNHFLVTLTQPTSPETSWEIVKVTGIAGDVFTIERGKEGTAAATWVTGTKVSLRVTKDGLDILSKNLAEKTIGYLCGGATSLSGFNLNAVPIGTLTSYSAPYGDPATITKAVTWTSTGVTSGSGLGIIGDNDATTARGATPGRGGFLYRARFVPQSIAAGNRIFMGVTNFTSTLQAANGATEPSAVVKEFFGLGCDSGDTNITIFTCDGVHATTKTPLNNPISLVSMQGKMYDVTLECLPGLVSSMNFKLVEWNGDTRTVLHDGAVSGTLPPAGLRFARCQWGWGQGADSGSARIVRFVRIYIEFPNVV